MSEMRVESPSSEELSEQVVKGMLEMKATDIKIMDLRSVKHAVADFFIICSGNSDTQIDSISESIEDEVQKNTKSRPWKREGRQNKEWIIIDYVDVVAHVFSKDKREFYALEDLWADAKVTSMSGETLPE
ncbi:MAG: ribosome silencing factor [Cyclobacteriaceae bacterium]